MYIYYIYISLYSLYSYNAAKDLRMYHTILVMKENLVILQNSPITVLWLSSIQIILHHVAVHKGNSNRCIIYVLYIMCICIALDAWNVYCSAISEGLSNSCGILITTLRMASSIYHMMQKSILSCFQVLNCLEEKTALKTKVTSKITLFHSR